MPIPTGGLPAGGFRNNTVLAMTPQIPTNTSRPTGSGAMDDANPPQRPRKRRRASGSPSSASKQPDFTPRATGYNPSSSLAIPGTEGQPSSQTSVSELSSQIHPKAPKRGWQRRRLLQQAPGADEKEAVSIFPTDNNGKIGNSIPINVLFEENLQQSFVSSSVVRCLGVDAQDLPVKRRAFFSKSSGLIQPQQYVVVAMEQVDIDNNRRTSQLGGMLVVDAARFKPGVHAVLRRDFFERARGGSLQPSDLQQNTHQPRFEDRYLFGQPAASLSQATSAMSGFTTENPFAHTATTSISPSFEDGSNTRKLFSLWLIWDVGKGRL
ncbi:hypothetical protein B0T21DRAFT_284614 [Apiosordaria backusii]|uniref:Uncharacterized protein n=1 Tax=Apiosordaria backusii TaxID=314023 RepID=A0AA40BRN7_9PEZI|nr:hypothetical protein B0T21DRAFT_284614 [Apiosordaria backusii]